MNAERRQQIWDLVLGAVRENKNPWNEVWNAVPEWYDRHVVSDALFALQHDGLIIWNPEYGYQIKGV